MFEKPGEALQCAQERKLRALATKAGCRAGHRVLEIGFGWGSLSILLAKHFGCHVTVRAGSGEWGAPARLAGERRALTRGLLPQPQGITLSEQQLALATQRAKDAGVAVRRRVRAASQCERPSDARCFCAAHDVLPPG